MDGSDRNNDRTFRANFSSDGVAKLRDQVKNKLKEFMGDYTDDTLVEYVIVLLRNGRHKEEAKKELNVFLGDDSNSFINWLWDHLSSNVHLYVQSRDSFSNEVAKTKPVSDRNDSQPEQLSDSFHSDSDYDWEKSVRESRSRRNREWRGLARDAVEPPPLLSSAIDNFHLEKPHRRSGRVNRAHSPRPSVHRKRKLQNEQSEQNERRPIKREATSHPIIDAPRRLLQFAVRDAVGTSRSSSSRPEPVLKRLRSVVSTSTGDAFQDDRSQKIRSVASVPHAVATAIKAAAEAAEDVIKVRCSGNVFDRLGRGMITSEAPVLENDYDDFDQMPAEPEYFQRNDYSEDFEGNMAIMDHGTGVTSESASDNDGYEDAETIRHNIIDASQAASCGSKDENSRMVQYSVAKDTDEVVRKPRMKDQDMLTPAVANASRKIVNISVNVNTWKPPHYKPVREVTELDNQVSEAGSGKPAAGLMREKNVDMAANDNAVVHMDTQKRIQKTTTPTPGPYSTVRPLEDADSRTVFVSNVHFAATKDTLSRHFNKFGEVLKVIILTDVATGQPKGSAYVEFMRKESAEHALSLNGTSFMSRILKVVRRGSAHHEASPMLTWPRLPRASPFSARIARGAFPRAIPNTFRSRLPVKPGPRSLQWKRDASVPVTALTGEGVAKAAPTSKGVVSVQNGASNYGNSVSSLTGRNLTYVRTEAKQV